MAPSDEKVTQVKIYECHICRHKRFSSEEYLRAHFARRHPALQDQALSSNPDPGLLAIPPLTLHEDNAEEQCDPDYVHKNQVREEETELARLTREMKAMAQQLETVTTGTQRVGVPGSSRGFPHPAREATQGARTTNTARGGEEVVSPPEDESNEQQEYARKPVNPPQPLRKVATEKQLNESSQAYVPCKSLM